MHAENFVPPIPKGKQILIQVEVAGVSFRAESVDQFAYGENQSLAIEREPENKHGKNAVKAFGIFTSKGKSKKVDLG